MSSFEEYIAGKAIIIREGKVLLLKESQAYIDGSNTGKWDVPGGRLQHNENFSTGIVREVKEECGLSVVSVGKPVHVQEWLVQRNEQSTMKIIGVYFLCEVSSTDVVVSTDHETHEWVPLDHIHDGRLYVGCVEHVLQKVIQ